ncbi:MAG: hypothetical protein ACD_51C00092G0004 [uncultured bacterium]|nr:MAG: hypothetical protein ACD_51C00092G0004 [uncultured bacterium]OGJ48143.1 MAG: hypothetical protein A2244_01505 [Candidatus Peregrinibacteria bacterium RIFOXYA2_FULL_41_18]OGJ49046.1 MAG: hypothetical protein A2344_00750 [Candidatus Peregrinibacteria bacterium RIFOXYB12_FULL_41_12]
MIQAPQIQEYFQQYADKYPRWARVGVREGDIIHLNWHANGMKLRVDDVNLDEKFWPQEEGLDPQEAFDRFLMNLSRGLGPRGMDTELFPPKSGSEPEQIQPLSMAVDRRKGECVEKAVIAIMLTQRWYMSMAITGLLGHDRRRQKWNHAWSLLFPQQGSPHLLDIENPVIVTRDGVRQEVPYLVPVTAYDEDARRFVIPDRWREGKIFETYDTAIYDGQNPTRRFSMMDMF